MSINRSNSKLRFNIVASSIYQLVATIVPIITIPYITRIFIVEQIGSYNLSYSIVVFLSLISKFGIDTYGVREISKASNITDRDQIYFNLFSIQLVNSLILFLLCNLIFYIFFDNISSSLAMTQSLLILVNILDISWFFIGIEAISKIILRNIVTKILSTALIFLLVNESNQLSMYALINILGIFLGNLVMVWASLSIVNYNNISINFSLIHLKNSFKLFIPKVLNNSYNTIDKSLIEYLSTTTNVGFYSEGQKFIKILFSVIEQAFNAISPRMSYYIANNEIIEVKKIFKKSLEYCIIFSTIMTSGILGLSEYFVDFFYGDGYSGVASVLNILSIALIIVPINGLITSGLVVPLSKDKIYRNSTISMILMGMLFLLILVPQYGAFGASIAYVFSQLSMLIYLSWSLKNIINFKSIVTSVLKIIILVIINISIINLLKYNINFENSFISFIFFGCISVGINCIYFLVNGTLKFWISKLALKW